MRKGQDTADEAGVVASVSAVVAPPSATPSASASAAPTVTATATAKKVASAAPATVECRGRNEAGLIELDLTWDKDTAKGTLKADGKSRPVIAELYKGLVLVDNVGTPSPLRGQVATVTTDGKKTIRIGDYKQPTFDCH